MRRRTREGVMKFTLGLNVRFKRDDELVVSMSFDVMIVHKHMSCDGSIMPQTR